MFNAFLHGATIMLVPFRSFNIDEARIYNQYMMFMLPRLCAGAIKDVDDYIDAVNDFVTTLNLDED